MTKRFAVKGMSCAVCASHVEKSVTEVDGVERVNVSLLTDSMTVSLDRDVADDIIIKAVEKAGYGAARMENAAVKKPRQAEKSDEEEDKTALRSLILSVVFMLAIMYISMGHMGMWPVPAFLEGHENVMVLALTEFILAVPVLYLNRGYYIRGFSSLLHRAPNMDSLIAVGSGAAYVYGVFAIYMIAYGMGRGDAELVHEYVSDLYFESGAMILTLISVGKYLEGRSRRKTSQAITRLMDLAPQTAFVVRDGIESEIPVEEVVPGDVIMVRAGQRIPVDAVILNGRGVVDESAITGESVPVERGEGDRVTGATINTSGAFSCRAVRVGNDTTLAQIMRLVEEAASDKAPIARLADRIGSVFVPVVMCIALVTFVFWMLYSGDFAFSLSMGITVLVISCPCALGLATPVAIMVGTGRGAANGILIRSADALQTASEVDTVIFDKTGTLTEGKPRVTDVLTFGGIGREELLAAACAVENKSDHPLAQAVIEYAAGQRPEEVDGFENVAGRGLSAVYRGKRLLAGNLAMMEEGGVNTASAKADADRLAREGKTVLYFALEESLIGLIAVADVPRRDSAESVSELKDMGLDVIMLTGDNKVTAEAAAAAMGIDKVEAQVLPQDKEGTVDAFMKKGKKVAMVGDGINDAPALTRADVGFAVGAGSDIAIDSADVVLMSSGIGDVAAAIRLSCGVMRNIKQNLFWAFFYNIIGIPIAAGVLFIPFGIRLTPMIAAACMSMSSICVVTNALRLRGLKLKRD